MNDLLQKDVPLRMPIQVRIRHQPLEIATVPVNVPPDHHRPFPRQDNHVAPTEPVLPVRRDSLIEQVDGCLWHFGSL